MRRVMIGATIALTALAGLGAGGPVTDSGATGIADLSDAVVVKIRQDRFQLTHKDLAIGGYDPVSYFPEGGAEPAKGSKDIELVHKGVRYRFASAEHRDAFKANPDKYEPAYGGWCAYAMAKDTYTKANPKRFLIQGGRLMLFYDGWLGDTLKGWNKEGPEKLEPLADAFWKAEVEKAAKKIGAGG